MVNLFSRLNVSQYCSFARSYLQAKRQLSMGSLCLKWTYITCVKMPEFDCSTWVDDDCVGRQIRSCMKYRKLLKEKLMDRFGFKMSPAIKCYCIYMQH